MFNVATDGSSERNATEQLYPILVHFNKSAGRIVTSLLSLPACEGQIKGADIFKLLNSKIEDWELCLGFCSDNANVMTGIHKDIAAFALKEHPSIFISWCICHLLHLATSNAA